MPRRLRFSPPGCVLHCVNRGNDKRMLFQTARDFEEFLSLIAWAKRKCPVRIIAYCVMGNHWHFLLWAEAEGDIEAFLHLLTTTHAIGWRKRTGTWGQGHVYQDRYRSRPIFSEAYYLNAVSYVEGNPLRAGLVSTASAWRWSSLAERLYHHRALLSPGPIPLPENWSVRVDQCLPETIIDAIRKDLRKH